MKHNHNHDNAPGPQLVPVRFEFTHPTANSVYVAGTFNQWKPEAKTLHPSGVGHWWKETALAPGTYEYCFVVDGQWMADPLAKESVPNPFGGSNSVLRVASSPAAGQLARAENLPLKNTSNRNDMRKLAEEMRALVTVAAGVAGEKLGEARKRRAAAPGGTEFDSPPITNRVTHHGRLECRRIILYP